MLNDLETVPFIGRTTAKNVRLSKKIASAINKSLTIENMNFNSKLGYDLNLIPEIAKKPSYYCDKDEVIYIQYNTKTKFIIPSIYINENRQNVFFKNSFKEIMSESSYDFSQDNITNINKGIFKKIDKDLYEISNISNLTEAYQFIEENRLDESFKDIIGKILNRVSTKAGNTIKTKTSGQDESSKNWSLIKTTQKDGEVYNPLGAANHLRTYIRQAIPKNLHDNIGDPEFEAYTAGFLDLSEGKINNLVEEIRKIEHKATDTPDADEVVKFFIQYYEKKVGMLDEYRSISDENIKKALGYAYEIVNDMKEKGFTEQNISKKIKEMSDIVDKVEKADDPSDNNIKFDLGKSVEAAIEDMNQSQSEWVKKLRKLTGLASVVHKLFTFMMTGLFRVLKAWRGGAALNFAAKGLALALQGAASTFGNNIASGLAKAIPYVTSFSKLLVVLPYNVLSWVLSGMENGKEIFGLLSETSRLEDKAIQQLKIGKGDDYTPSADRVLKRIEDLRDEQVTNLGDYFQDALVGDPSNIIENFFSQDLLLHPVISACCFLASLYLIVYHHKLMLEAAKEYSKIFLDFADAFADVFRAVAALLGRKGKTKNLKRVYIEQVKSLERFSKSGIKGADKAVKGDLSSASFEKFVKLIITNDAFGIDTKLSNALVLKAAIESLKGQIKILKDKDDSRNEELVEKIKSKKEEIEKLIGETPGAKNDMPNLTYMSNENKQKLDKLRKELKVLEKDAENNTKYKSIIDNYNRAITALNILISDEVDDMNSTVEELQQNASDAEGFVS